MLNYSERESTGRTRRGGFTLIELLVVIAIIAILAAILFPVFTSAKVSGKRAACLGELKQLGNAVDLYQQDFNGCYPSTEYYNNAPDGSDQKNWGYHYWVKVLAETYTKSLSVFNCPGAANPVVRQTRSNGEVKIGYSYNEYIWHAIAWNYPWYKESAMRYPKYVLLLADGYDASLVNDWTDPPPCPLYETAKAEGLPTGMLRVKYADSVVRDSRGNPISGAVPRERHGGSNVLFADGHARKLNKGDYKCSPGGKYEFPVVCPEALPYLPNTVP